MKLASSLVCAVLLAAAPCFAADVADDYPFVRAQTFEDAWKASCRVCVDGARGSGTHVGGVANAAYIMTNYHVVTKNDSARLDFWTNGKMESVRGVVVWRAYNAQKAEDFAAIAVRVDDLKKINPPWVALGGADARPSVGAVIVSSGAPDGRFPQAWKGQILEYYRGETAIFSPPPVPGQSGSAICEYVDGELFVTGILTWLIGEKGNDNSKGGAIPVANIYRALEERGTNVDFHDDASPIPPGAQECSELVGPCVLEFTQANCPPCKDAETDVAQLRAFRDSRRSFDLIVLDPPKFADSRNHVEKACRAYKDANRLAFKLLRPGGLLATFSCSGAIDPALFATVVAEAACEAGRDARIVGRFDQSPDHPVSLACPEGRYLKGLLCAAP